MSTPLSVYLIAGEPSGDILGMRLMKGIAGLVDGPVTFMGVGGPLMQGEGLESLFPMQDLTVMGLAEVLPRLPTILGRIKQTAADIRDKKPDVVVTIDAPDFCFRVAKKLKGSGIPVVHYVAPSVWVWREGRAKKVARLVDHVMCLLPFEPPYFERAGVDATFVGHSILESGADRGDGPAFRARHGIGADETLLVMLPGSRGGEIQRLMATFIDAVVRVRREFGSLKVVVPTVPSVADAVVAACRDLPDTLVVEGQDEKYGAFAAADAALAASGTVSLELAMAGVPSLIAYRMSPLTTALAKPFVNIRFASIVNLILDRAAFPEFLMGDCTADKIAPALLDLLRSPQSRDAQQADIRRALEALKPADEPPSVTAARVVLKVAAGKENRRGA